jgi:hypothetical protein
LENFVEIFLEWGFEKVGGVCSDLSGFGAGVPFGILGGGAWVGSRENWIFIFLSAIT